MQIERRKNASRNIIYGGGLKVFQIILPFVMRTVMIHYLGVEYLGLNSLFASILQVLNLAELGVGSAMVYSMYKPIAEDDKARIKALMRLYKLYYRIIGLVIVVLGIILLPFVPRLIHGDLPPDVNVYVLYLIHLTATVFSYWLFAYKNALLQAHQRNDVISKITFVITSIQYLLQFFVLVFLKNYYPYIIIVLIAQIVTNLITSIVVDKIYPEYKPDGELPQIERRQINQRIRDLFTSKVGNIVVNSADTIVISAFLGLTTLAIYQNYYFILTAVIGVVDVIFVSCTAGIGNSIIVESQEKNFKDLCIFTLLIAWVSGFCTTCFLCLYQPFMVLWVGPDLTLEMPAVVCFCVYYYVYEINRLLNTYKDAGGIWHQDRFRPLVTALGNLCLNLIMVQIWGIYGVLLSTVISMVGIGMPWILHNLFTTLFERSYIKEYLLQLLRYTIITIAVATLTYYICSIIHLGIWSTLMVRGIICISLPNVLLYVVYRKDAYFSDIVYLIRKTMGGKSVLRRFFQN